MVNVQWQYLVINYLIPSIPPERNLQTIAFTGTRCITTTVLNRSSSFKLRMPYQSCITFQNKKTTSSWNGKRHLSFTLLTLTRDIWQYKTLQQFSISIRQRFIWDDLTYFNIISCCIYIILVGVHCAVCIVLSQVKNSKYIRA